MSSTSQLAYLPLWSLENNGELAFFLRSITIRTLPGALRDQLYFYIVFKCVLVVTGLVLLVMLMLTGRWWVVRIVRVPNGLLFCPNACEALVLVAALFYMIDMVFRGLSLRWYFDENSNQHGMFVLYGVRLYFLWLACFIHNAASILVYPLNPQRVRPLYWHFFLFSFPLAFLAAFLPPIIRTERAYRRGNAIALPLLQRLLADPQAPVSADDARLAALANEQVFAACKHLRQFGIVVLAFMIPITMGTTFNGVAICRQTWLRYNNVKRALQRDVENRMRNAQEVRSTSSSSEHRHVEVDTTAVRGDEDGFHARKDDMQPNTAALTPLPSQTTVRATSLETLTTSTSPPSPKQRQGRRTSSTWSERRPLSARWHTISLRWRIVYLFGLEPLERMDTIDFEERRPTPESAVAVLKDFLVFLSVQFTCLILIGLTVIACVALVIGTVSPTLSSGRGELFRSTYTYLVLEIWVIVTIGSPLIVLMLWRQVYPIHVNFEADVYERRSAFQMHSIRPQCKKSENTLVPAAAVPQNVSMTSRRNLPSNGNQPVVSEEHNVQVEGSDGDDIQTEDQHHANKPSRIRAVLSRTHCAKGGERESHGTGTLGGHDVTIPSLREPNANEDRMVGRHHPNGSEGSVGLGANITRFSDSIDISARPLRGIGTTELSTRDACGIFGSDAGVRSIVLEALDAANGFSGSGSGRRRSSTTLWERKQLQLQSQQQEHCSIGNTGQPSFSRRHLASLDSLRRPSVQALPSVLDEPVYATPYGFIKNDVTLG